MCAARIWQLEPCAPFSGAISEAAALACDHCHVCGFRQTSRVHVTEPAAALSIGSDLVLPSQSSAGQMILWNLAFIWRLRLRPEKQ